MDFLHSFDFVTQDLIDSSEFEQPADGLSHHAYANRLLTTIQNMPPGAVVGIQGEWGRGKTDVLSRLAAFAKMIDESNTIRHVFWINPWQYGTNDLLTPLILRMITKGKHQNSAFLDKPGMLKVLKSLIVAGTNFGLKATGEFVPGYRLLNAAAGPVEAILKSFLDGREDQAKRLKDAIPDPDPVSKMGDQFRFLVDQLLETQTAGTKILVCVDDLDRCLPGRQIAMLEALRFLVSSRAKAVFVVGLDERSIGESLSAYYGIGKIDAIAYLDKMFDIRIHLPAVSSVKHTELINQFLDMEWRTGRSVRNILADAIPMEVDEFVRKTRESLCVGSWKVELRRVSVSEGKKTSCRRVRGVLPRRFFALGPIPEGGPDGPFRTSERDPASGLGAWDGAQVAPLQSLILRPG
jgi:hypothetical protein